MFLPWQYYYAEFTVNKSFNEYVIPISSFNKSGYFIPGKINSKNIHQLWNEAKIKEELNNE